jgi:hypothetical protein
MLGYDIGAGIFILLVVIQATVSVIYRRKKLDWVFAILIWGIFIFFILRLLGVV